MTGDRVEAWGRQLRLVHAGLRAQLDRVRESVERGEASAGLPADLRLFCLGFCDALAGHHGAEDRRLFPHLLSARSGAHPGLAGVIARLEEDHRLLAGLIRDLDQATAAASLAGVLRHLDGITAIMESHFRYEERTLTPVLDAMTARDPDIRSLLTE